VRTRQESRKQERTAATVIRNTCVALHDHQLACRRGVLYHHHRVYLLIPCVSGVSQVAGRQGQSSRMEDTLDNNGSVLPCAPWEEIYRPPLGYGGGRIAVVIRGARV
jgi:hypothetical protein